MRRGPGGSVGSRRAGGRAPASRLARVVSNVGMEEFIGIQADEVRALDGGDGA